MLPHKLIEKPRPVRLKPDTVPTLHKPDTVPTLHLPGQALPKPRVSSEKRAQEIERQAQKQVCVLFSFSFCYHLAINWCPCISTPTYTSFQPTALKFFSSLTHVQSLLCFVCPYKFICTSKQANKITSKNLQKMYIIHSL